MTQPLTARADANQFKDAFIRGQKDNEALFGKTEATKDVDDKEEKEHTT